MIRNNRKTAPLTLPRIAMKKSGLSVSNPSYFPRKTRLQMPRKHGLRAKWEKALKKSGNGQSVHLLSLRALLLEEITNVDNIVEHGRKVYFHFSSQMLQGCSKGQWCKFIFFKA